MAYSSSHVNNGSHGDTDEDDKFERDLKEILNDSSNVSSGHSNSSSHSNSSGHIEIGPGMVRVGGSSSGASQSYRPNTLPSGTHAGSVKAPVIAPATSNIPLSSPDHSRSTPTRAGNLQPVPLSPQSKLDSLKAWSFNTYKFTRQLLSERLGRGSKTVDADLEAQIESLRDTQLKYANILRLAQALTSHFSHMTQTQRALSDAFSDLSQKNPELREEFLYNSETQRVLYKNGETLLGALSFFTSTMNTLCNKTMDDTLLTIKQYEAARVEYDAYRTDLEALQSMPRDASSGQKVEDAQKRFQVHKDKFDKLRADVMVKMKFLDENRVKVMHKQLLLFHNAVASYFSGNQCALEDTLKQFNIKLKTPNSDKPSWLEAIN